MAVLVRLRPGKTELRDRWRYEIFSMMFSRFFSLHPSIGKKAPISRCKIGGSPPMRWPVSAHTSFNWLDTQRNSSGGCIRPLASELLGTWIGPDASMAIKHRCAWTSRANPAGLTNTIKLLRIRRELFDGRAKNRQDRSSRHVDHGGCGCSYHRRRDGLEHVDSPRLDSRELSTEARYRPGSNPGGGRVDECRQGGG